MLKAAVIYSSQNGSTQKIAKRISDALINEGNEVTLINTNQGEKIIIEDFDIIGIGCPTYISRPSYEIMDFLDSIKNFHNKKVFTFVTYSTEIGDGANRLRKKIKIMNGIDIGHISCTGKNLFPGYTKYGYLFSPKNPDDKEMIKIDIFAKTILSNIKSDTLIESVPYDRRMDFIYRFERFVTNRILIKLLYRHFFSFSKKLCNDCNLCANSCPKKNIFKNKKDKRKLGSECILCLNCEISCPNKAISSPVSSWLIFAPFLKMNILKAKNKNIPYQQIP